MRGVVLVLVVLMAAVCSGLQMDIKELKELRKEYDAYKAKHEKSYATEGENNSRMMLYLDRKELIKLHNKDYDQGLFSWKLGTNKFSDMTEEELPNKETVVDYIAKKIR